MKNSMIMFCVMAATVVAFAASSYSDSQFKRMEKAERITLDSVLDRNSKDYKKPMTFKVRVYDPGSFVAYANKIDSQLVGSDTHALYFCIPADGTCGGVKGFKSEAGKRLFIVATPNNAMVTKQFEEFMKQNAKENELVCYMTLEKRSFIDARFAQQLHPRLCGSAYCFKLKEFMPCEDYEARKQAGAGKTAKPGATSSSALGKDSAATADSEISPVVFKAEMMKTPVSFRCRIQMSEDHWSSTYEDKSSYCSTTADVFNRHSDTRKTFYPFFPKDSPMGKELYKILSDGEEHDMFVTLKYREGEKRDCSPEIVDFKIK